MANRTGTGRFAELRQQYPIHHGHFKNLQERVKQKGLETDLTNDRDGLLKFIGEIGTVPKNLKCPSVGRKEHSKGYITGNYGWQERSENVREMNYRTNSGPRTGAAIRGRRQTESHIRNKARAMQGSKRSQAQRKRISQGVKAAWAKRKACSA